MCETDDVEKRHGRTDRQTDTERFNIPHHFYEKGGGDNKLKQEKFDQTQTQTYWTKISTICKDVAKEIAPQETKSAKFNNTEIINLSRKQKHLRIEIEKCQNRDEKTKLKIQRNTILTELHKQISKEYEKKLENKIEDIEKSKNDSHRMFKAIRVIQKKN